MGDTTASTATTNDAASNTARQELSPDVRRREEFRTIVDALNTFPRR